MDFRKVWSKRGFYGGLWNNLRYLASSSSLVPTNCALRCWFSASCVPSLEAGTWQSWEGSTDHLLCKLWMLLPLSPLARPLPLQQEQLDCPWCREKAHCFILCPAPLCDLAFLGSVLRNLYQPSAFIPCLKNHGMHLTFVEEFNTKHCICKASPYYFFSFLNTPPQFSPSWPDIFIARLWFGKLWVGKVQG